MLKKVDAVPITSYQKLLLYWVAVCPRLNLDFMANQLPMSWVTTTLEATTTRFLKKWIGLAKPADPSRLYFPKKKRDLGLPSISTVYQNQQRPVASLILTSHGPVVQYIAHLSIKREQNLHRLIYRPTLEVRDIWHNDSDANRKTLLKKAKIQFTERESNKRLEDAKSQQHQGQLMHATEEKASSTLSSVEFQLQPEVLSLSLNAVQDTLSYNANLALWRKKDGLSDVCKLYKMWQTLSHVLNQ